jgi:hypothetical protein
MMHRSREEGRSGVTLLRGGIGTCRRIIAVAVVTTLLSACGNDAAPPDNTAVPTAALATATPNTVAATPEVIAVHSTPVLDARTSSSLPSSDRSFVSQQAELGPVVWTAMVDPVTLAPIQEVEAFTIDASTIYAAVPVLRIEPGTEVSASWSYNDTPISGVGSTFTATEAAEGVWLEFHLAQTGAEEWPDGTFAITIMVDGTPALASSIMVGPP